jgi:uncharacterized protein (TIGR00299 family) protein
MMYTKKQEAGFGGIALKVLYFDCFSGISGDMTLGALLDLGVDEDRLIQELEKLNLIGYEISIKRMTKNGIFGTDVEIILADDHVHDDEHGSESDHNVFKHRTFKDIKELIVKSELSMRVKKLSIDIFTEIARAEANVHNTDIDKVHFHEVGAVDSIVDIVGTAICFEELEIERVYSSALHDGSGFIKCQHGEIPVPVPAVLEMLKNTAIPLIIDDISTELITPTGMGIIKTLSCDFGNMPAMSIERIGYGFGKRDTGKLNALRVVLGSMFEEDKLREEIIILETNLDDISSEVLGYTFEKLMESGALDVFFTPIYMKKNRPAYMLSIVCRQENEEKMIDCVFKETSTLGIRRSINSRYIMNRENIKIKTELGSISCKLSERGSIKKNGSRIQ